MKTLPSIQSPFTSFGDQLIVDRAWPRSLYIYLPFVTPRSSSSIHHEFNMESEVDMATLFSKTATALKDILEEKGVKPNHVIYKRALGVVRDL